MAATDQVPICLSIGDGEKYEVGTLKLSVGEMLAYCDGRAKFAIDLTRLADALEAVASEIRVQSPRH